jgi:hypothetical protein
MKNKECFESDLASLKKAFRIEFQNAQNERVFDAQLKQIIVTSSFMKDNFFSEQSSSIRKRKRRI